MDQQKRYYLISAVILLIAALISVPHWFGEIPPLQESNSSRDNHRQETRNKSTLTIGNTHKRKAPIEQGQEKILSLQGVDSTTMGDQNCEVAKDSVRDCVTSVDSPARVSVAAALYEALPESEFQKMDAHEQAAVLELGAYAQQEVRDIDSASQTETSNPTREKSRITAEADAFLRMSVGHERFNHLSSLAASNRNEQSKELLTPSDTRSK
ncbi:MAG: hypothetical protein ABI600_14710 [Luteolibacter sp.]